MLNDLEILSGLKGSKMHWNEKLAFRKRFIEFCKISSTLEKFIQSNNSKEHTSRAGKVALDSLKWKLKAELGLYEKFFTSFTSEYCIYEKNFSGKLKDFYANIKDNYSNNLEKIANCFKENSISDYGQNQPGM